MYIKIDEETMKEVARRMNWKAEINNHGELTGFEGVHKVDWILAKNIEWLEEMYVFNEREIGFRMEWKDFFEYYREEVEKLTFSPISDNTVPAPISTGKITFIIRSK